MFRRIGGFAALLAAIAVVWAQVAAEETSPGKALPRDTVAAATEPASGADLAGRWRMFLPAGFEHEVRLLPAGGGAYRLEPASLNSSGVYAVRKDRLVLVEPTGNHQPGYEWTLRSNYLMTLTAQPGNTGSDYTGATLFRSSDRKPAGSR